MHINRDGGRFSKGKLSFNLYMNASRVEISRQGEPLYTRTIDDRETWYDESHQRIMDAARELEAALRAVVSDEVK